MGKLQKLDSRIQIMLKNGVQQNYRTVFVMVGNKGQDQVPIMHQILNSLVNKGKLNLLWCYKKEISFSTKKRKAGFTADGTVFEQFICSTDIRWCYYSETHKILGQTYDMCVLQDFEALTPNTIARTIETVAGGGLIVFLLKTMDSLRCLCTMVMDVHSRFRTEAHQDVVCRFNERFLLSLTNNSRCLVLDDRWNVLPLSRTIVNSILALPPKSGDELSPEQSELQKLKVSLVEDGSPFAPLIKLCITFDQAKSLVQFCASLATTSQLSGDKNSSKNSAASSLMNYIEDKKCTSSAIVIVTSGRGRGKSAALGLGLAAAIQTGMPNIFVSAPSPENVSTLIQFVVRGLNALGYEEHQDYVAIRSTDPDYSNAIIRIDVYRQNHRQSIIYLPPWELANQSGLKQADLVCIDEAAAIPLPLVQSSISGPRLVFMASTINGYEGTGRSLSLKLISQLRNECILSQVSSKLSNTNVEKVKHVNQGRNATSQLGKGFRSTDTSRILYEVGLNEAIRYANGDPVERWLSDLLCLDCGQTLIGEPNSTLQTSYPPVEQCQLFYVNRDTLFAYHKSTEIFLHRLMSLYVASHYKNTPNDLQLLSDAPAHHIFCLLTPYDSKSGTVPEILCVLQVCLEGQINKHNILKSLSRGLRPSGDLIPWTISQQFCDAEFGQLSGARVVRIATHPDYQNLGYGSRALKLLHEYYDQSKNAVTPALPQNTNSDAQPTSIDAIDKTCEEEEEEVDGDDELIADDNQEDVDNEEAPHSKLFTETIKRRGPDSLPSLLSRLSERPAEQLDYIGVSFGSTPSLMRFWKRAGYIPVYIRQTLNNLTGEFTCIMLKQLNNNKNNETMDTSSNWLLNYFQAFTQRFIPLLPGPFRYMDAAYTLEIISNKSIEHHLIKEFSPFEARTLFNSMDLERLRRYTRSLVDFRLVNDLLPSLAKLYFEKRLPNVRLNKTQQVILLGMGLQYKTIEKLADEFDRLIGNPTVVQSSATSKFIRPDDAVNSVLACSAEDSQLGLMMSDKPTKLQTAAAVESGWVRKIRGLLFVVVRELVRSLDRLMDEGSEDKSKGRGQVNFEPAKGSQLVPGRSVALELEQDSVECDNDDDDDEEEVDDEMNSDTGGVDSDEETKNVDNELEASLVSPDEIERRKTLVRQLMTDEMGSGSGYKVHGSEIDWARAVVGHGSDLDSMTVKMSKAETKGKKKDYLGLNKNSNHSKIKKKKKNAFEMKKKLKKKFH